MQKILKRRKMSWIAIVVGLMIFSLLFCLFSSDVIFADIRLKEIGDNVILSPLRPGDSYIVSETVVKNGRLISDRIVQQEVMLKKYEPEKMSIVLKALNNLGIKLLDMFVCNVENY